MHATIQKPIEEIVSFIKPGEKVFVVGCNNCAWKCHSGGEDETENMAERLSRRGVDVVGYTVPGPQGMSLCKLDHTRKVLQEDYKDTIAKADSFLVLGCGQGVHAVNVTDNQSAVMRLGSLAASVGLKQKGIEPVYQLTCRDRNRIALQSDLLTAYSLGIDNVLLITGDHIQLGDHKEAKPVFDLDSVQLISMAKGLRNGHDITGNAIENPPNMAHGAVVNPNFEPLELQLLKMRKKIDAGAEFFQTQAIYDRKVFETFMDKASTFNMPIQVGLVVLKYPQMGKFM